MNDGALPHEVPNMDEPTEPAGVGGGTAGAAESLPLLEERLRVTKRVVERGRVRVATRTEAVEHRVRETLRGERVVVTRVPIGRELAPGEPAPAPRLEGAVTVIPVLEERLVVETRLVLVEEVRVERVATSEEVEIPVTLRRQHAEVERAAPTPGAAPATPLEKETKR